MRLKVDDGVVIFATHFIYAEIDRNDKEVSRKLTFLQLEQDGIVIYPDNNLVDVENILKELNISYTVEVLTPDPLHKTKCQGVYYCSRTEAIEHFLNDSEPESQIIPNLKKKLTDEKARNDKLEEKLTKMESRLSKGGL